MHGDTADIVPLQLYFAGVEAGAYDNAERLNRLGDRRGTAHGPGRAVECGEKAVAERLDLMAAETADLLSHCLIVSLPQLAPSPVAKLRSSAGRVYNVSKHDPRQDAIGFRFAAGSSQKLLDLIGHAIGEIVIIEREMIGPRQFDEFRPGDMVGNIATVLHDVTDPVQYQTGSVDRRQDLADVYLGIHPD